MNNDTIATAPFERLKINGMDVLFLPRPGSGLVAATTVIRRGAADELYEEHGLASFTIHMLMRGTARHSSEQFAHELESLGAMVGPGDGLDTCSLSMRSAAPEAEEALRLYFEALRRPVFDPHEHAIHREETLAELRMQDDDKFGFTFREYQKIMFAGHGYGHPVEGEPAEVERITPEDCRRWHAETIHPENMLFVAVGDFAADHWEDLLDELTAGWPAAVLRPRIEVAPPPSPGMTLNLTKPDLMQGFIVAGFRTPRIGEHDYPALRLASAALGEGFGGRIFTNLRDKKSLAYALGSTLHTYRHGGNQVLYIGTKPESIEEARAGLLEEADYLRQNLLTDEELNRAREFVIGKYLMGQQSHAQRAANLAFWEEATGDAKNGADWPVRLSTVTPRELHEAVVRWWHTPTTAILRPEDAVAPA